MMNLACLRRGALAGLWKPSAAANWSAPSFRPRYLHSQNWIGGTRPGNAIFVPPPVNELDACLDLFERFMHEENSRLPSLVKAGLLHVQFETIHPFLDGNGRIGRLLVTLYSLR